VPSTIDEVLENIPEPSPEFKKKAIKLVSDAQEGKIPPEKIKTEAVDLISELLGKDQSGIPTGKISSYGDVEDAYTGEMGGGTLGRALDEGERVISPRTTDEGIEFTGRSDPNELGPKTRGPALLDYLRRRESGFDPSQVQKPPGIKYTDEPTRRFSNNELLNAIFREMGRKGMID
jgi:hypothetical protein